MAVVIAVLWGVAVYLAAGVLIGVWFVARVVDRIDPAAKSATWAFRLIILPGCVALWPVLLRWTSRSRTRELAR